jgi:hypothetical protein
MLILKICCEFHKTTRREENLKSESAKNAQMLSQMGATDTLDGQELGYVKPGVYREGNRGVASPFGNLSPEKQFKGQK